MSAPLKPAVVQLLTKLLLSSLSLVASVLGRDVSYFVDSSYPWFYRGSYSSNSYASPFYANDYNGYSGTNYGSRAALLALPTN